MNHSHCEARMRVNQNQIRINGMNAIEHSNHSHCEARIRVWHSAGYEALMEINGMNALWHSPSPYGIPRAFCEASTPQNRTYQGGP
ncbi:MAG: hypothetical protein OXU36_21240 [Candidatus Poribacteria bacterium]|nr:hypothetical protein [Candidatus Poribacteria bacterium]